MISIAEKIKFRQKIVKEKKGWHTLVIFLNCALVIAILEEFVPSQLEGIGVVCRRGVGHVRRRGRAELLLGGAVDAVPLLRSVLLVDVHGTPLVVGWGGHGRQSTTQLVGREIERVEVLVTRRPAESEGRSSGGR